VLEHLRHFFASNGLIAGQCIFYTQKASPGKRTDNALNLSFLEFDVGMKYMSLPHHSTNLRRGYQSLTLAERTNEEINFAMEILPQSQAFRRASIFL
jgi:hypothetical protein